MKINFYMNNLIISIKNISVYDLTLLSIAFLMCFDKPMMRLILLFFSIVGLFNANYLWFKTKITFYKLFSTILWIIPCLQLIFMSSFQEFWPKLETKLCLLIFPLIFAISKDNKKNFIIKVLKFFVYGCFLSIFLCFAIVCFKFFVLKSVSNISYNNLSTFHHPSYYAMYINFSIGILYFRLLYPVKKYRDSLCILFVIFTFSCFVILLASRTGWITNLITLVLFILFHIKNKSLKRIHVIFGLCMVSCFTLMSRIPFIENRTNEVIENTFKSNEVKTLKSDIVDGNTLKSDIVDDNTLKSENVDGNALKSNNVDGNALKSNKKSKKTPPSSTNVRKLAWKTSLEIINKNLLFGVGTGNSTKILNLAYEIKGYKSLKKKGINSHNQFIQFQLDHGLVGSIFLIFFTLGMLILSLFEKDYLYALFLIIIILNFMTESMLETQSGVVFFSFFNTLFFYNWVDKKFRTD